jgi:hypothetical protein
LFLAYKGIRRVRHSIIIILFRILSILYNPLIFIGWVECPKIGKLIAGLLPSKVPLGARFNEVVEAGKRYSPQHVGRLARAVGREVATSSLVQHSIVFEFTFININLIFVGGNGGRPYKHYTILHSRGMERSRL